MYTYNFKDDKNKQVSTAETPNYLSFEGFEDVKNLKEWSPLQLVGFRIIFVFFLIQIVPWHPEFWQQLFSIHWLGPDFKYLLDLAAFLPEVISAPKWGVWSFSNWFVYLGIAVITATVWGRFDRSKEYYFLNYLLRAGIRYKLALGLIAYGFYLVFQQHMPYPSLSNLHTNYGDLFAWKLYFQTTAINPAYESFLGFVEIVAAILILYPKTVTFGTGLVLGFLGNVAMVNLFYDVGDHVYVNFLLLSSIYLFSYDVPRLYALLVKGTKAIGEKFYPSWSVSRIKNVRQSLRVLFLVFVVIIGLSGFGLTDEPFKVPQENGIAGSYGYYIPTQFKLNDQVIPYSTTDPNRWQDVIFEKWATISINVNRPILLDITQGDGVATNDLERNYESAGAGGRHYFSYKKDPSKDVIYLQNKNINHREEKLALSYSFPTDSTMVLEGTNEKSEKVYMELLRIEKKYFMYEGRRGRIKL